jgi:hypothetical protein
MQELLDGVVDAFRAVVKSGKEDAITNFSSRDISQQSMSTSS